MVIVALPAAALLVTLAPSGIESPEGVERKAGGENGGWEAWKRRVGGRTCGSPSEVERPLARSA